MKGIPNIGNTCFINSSLQIINNIDDLRQYILSNNYNTSLFEFFNKNKRNLPENYELYKHLLLNFQKIIFSLNSDENISKYIEILCKNLKDLADKGDYIASNICDLSIHNDAEEFLTFILDKIEDFTIDNNFKNNKNINFKNFYKNNNIIINSVKIQQITQYKCLNCNNLTKLNYNNYLNKIQLSISKNNIRSFEDALNNYTLTNEMNDYTCENCKHSGKAKERTLISSLSKYIIIQLLRFRNDGSKINKSIDIPLVINLDKYSHKLKNTDYKLQSINCHIDFNMNTGHYISITNEDNQWYLQNDEQIKKINNTFVLEQIKTKGYFFIYKRI
jgi:ubiquitin C-terminal hydrolase